MARGNVIYELRKERNISQQKLADAMGISQATIAKIEVNRNEATAATIRKLATFFDVSADYLLGLEDDFGARTAPAPAVMGDTNNAQERELLELFRTLSPYLQGLTLDTVRGWAGGAGDKSLHKKA